MAHLERRIHQLEQKVARQMHNKPLQPQENHSNLTLEELLPGLVEHRPLPGNGSHQMTDQAKTNQIGLWTNNSQHS